MKMNVQVEVKYEVEVKYKCCMQLVECRCMSGHDEGSARKLAGMGCSEPWRVHKDRRSLSGIFSVPRE